MTLDEGIKHCNEVAEEFENVNEEEISRLYADDTECIENHKASCMKYAEEYRQIATWLIDYKRLLEKEASQKENIEKIKEILARPVGSSPEEKAYNYMMQIIDIKEVLEED